MTYYISTRMAGRMDDALARTEEALKAEGFGVLTLIDIADTLKKKIDADFRPYVILGACNPGMAHKALLLEDKVGTMLPCNVIVQQLDDGIEVAAIDPVASMQAIDNPQLHEAAREVRTMLAAAIDRLA